VFLNIMRENTIKSAEHNKKIIICNVMETFQNASIIVISAGGTNQIATKDAVSASARTEKTMTAIQTYGII
jgi:regulator of RNase E activity RraA